MERKDNYRIQADQAKARFLGYDQEALIRKLELEQDKEYLYVKMLCQPYRIHRTTGDISRQVAGIWQDANSFGEVMVLLDLVCDSREDRFLTGQWKSLQDFGLMFHRSLLENGADPWALRFNADPAALERACLAMGGVKLLQGMWPMPWSSSMVCPWRYSCGWEMRNSRPSSGSCWMGTPTCTCATRRCISPKACC